MKVKSVVSWILIKSKKYLLSQRKHTYDLHSILDAILGLLRSR